MSNPRLPATGLVAVDETIRGGFGRITTSDVHSPSIKRRFSALLPILRLGISVVVGDNDAHPITTYAPAHRPYGTSLLWTLALLVVVSPVPHPLVLRFRAARTVGHRRLLRRRFGSFWAVFSLIDLLRLNFLTLVTEFIGIRYALGHIGIPPYASVFLMAAV